MNCPPHLLARIKSCGGIIQSSGCFYERNYNDEWANPDVHDDYRCFGFNCPIARNDDDFEEFEERLMTSDEILQGAQARNFQHYNTIEVDWRYFEQRLDAAIKYYLSLTIPEQSPVDRHLKEKYGEL